MPSCDLTAMPTWLSKLIELAPDVISFVGAVLMAYPPLKVAVQNRVLTGLLGRDLSKTKVGSKWGPQTIETIRAIVQQFSANDFANMLRGLLLTALGAGVKVVVVALR